MALLEIFIGIIAAVTFANLVNEVQIDSLETVKY